MPPGIPFGIPVSRPACAVGSAVVARIVTAVVLAAALVVPLPAPAQSGAGEPHPMEEMFQDFLEDALENLASRRRPGVPVPTLPKDDGTLAADGGPVTLQWQYAERARTYSVEVDCLGCESPGQWSLDALGRPWHTADNIDQVYYRLDAAPAGYQYRWRVQGIRDGRTGDWSAWSAFSTASFQQDYVEPGRAPATEGEIDSGALQLAGRWVSSQGSAYDLARAGPRIIWSDAGGRDSGSGLLRSGGVIEVEQWTGSPAAPPARGYVTETDAGGRAMRIEWENGVTFSRDGAAAGGAGQPASGPASPAPGTGEGYCCVDGELYQGSDVDCAAYGGVFSLSLEEARQTCGR